MNEKELLAQSMGEFPKQKVWRQKFRLYSRFKTKDLFCFKIMFFSIPIVILLCMLNEWICAFLFQEMLGFDLSKALVASDMVLFCLFFSVNSIAIFQTKYADNKLYEKFTFNSYSLLGMLVIYAVIVIFFEHSISLSSYISAVGFSIGGLQVLVEFNFKEEALQSKKDEIKILQKTRDLKSYITKKLIHLEKTEKAKGELTEFDKQRKSAYTELQKIAEKEHDVLIKRLKI
jgi:hypothetical protein